LSSIFASIRHTHTAQDLPTATDQSPGIVLLSDSVTGGGEFSIDAAASTTAVNTAWEKAMYGESSTQALYSTKVVTCSNYKLVAGQLVAIQFNFANSYVSGALSLNINNKGTKTIYANGSATSSSNTLLWNANDVLLFAYDGNYYHFVSRSSIDAAEATDTWYGESTSAGSSATKSATVSGSYVLKDGEIVSVRFEIGNTNTSQLTLNVNGT
jgi:hypothetical protein